MAQVFLAYFMLSIFQSQTITRERFEINHNAPRKVWIAGKSLPHEELAFYGREVSCMIYIVFLYGSCIKII